MSIFGISTPEPWAKRLVPSPVFSAMAVVFF
jgi:hypothetical protein